MAAVHRLDPLHSCSHICYRFSISPASAVWPTGTTRIKSARVMPHGHPLRGVLNVRTRTSPLASLYSAGLGLFSCDFSGCDRTKFPHVHRVVLLPTVTSAQQPLSRLWSFRTCPQFWHFSESPSALFTFAVPCVRPSGTFGLLQCGTAELAIVRLAETCKPAIASS